MSKELKLNIEQAPARPVKPKPRVFLPTTVFDNASPYYTVIVDEAGLCVLSECCGDTMSRETAEKVRDAITEWLAWKDKPVPKTREEMAAFATEWDAKVEADRAKR